MNVALRAEDGSLEGMGSPPGGIWGIILLNDEKGEKVGLLARLTHGGGKKWFCQMTTLIVELTQK